MKAKVTSVLIFPYNNQLEVRVSRSVAYNKPIEKMNIYHARYNEKSKVARLAKLSSKLIELNTLQMIKDNAIYLNPTR